MNNPGSKICPQCSKSIAAETSVCYMCGYNFAPPTAPYMGEQRPPDQYQGYPHYVPPGSYAPQQNSNDTFAVVSLILGIISILSMCIWFVSIPLGIGAICCGIPGRRSSQSGLGTAGLVCGIAGLIFTVIWITLIVGLYAAGLRESNYQTPSGNSTTNRF